MTPPHETEKERDEKMAKTTERLLKCYDMFFNRAFNSGLTFSECHKEGMDAMKAFIPAQNRMYCLANKAAEKEVDKFKDQQKLLRAIFGEEFPNDAN